MLERARTVVMWNPSAGSANRAAEVRRRLEEMPQVTIQTPAGREDAIEETARVAGEGAELIVGAGGDGTISSVVEGLVRAESECVLGILPLGSGNDLARALNIPLDAFEALQVLTSGVVSKLDVFKGISTEGTRTCANMLTGGNTGRYLQQMNDEIKQRWGPLCYLRGVIDVLQDLQPYEIEVTCDDGPPESFMALNVFVANGRFSGGGLGVSPEAELDDGRIDLVIVRDGDPGEIASLTTEYVLADYLQHELIVFRRVRRLTIASDPEMPLTADGDEFGMTPLSVGVERQRLSVLVPGEVTT